MNYKGKIGLTKFLKYFFYVFKAIYLIVILIILIISITSKELDISLFITLTLMSGGSFLIIYIAERFFLLIASYFEDAEQSKIDKNDIRINFFRNNLK